MRFFQLFNVVAFLCAIATVSSAWDGPRKGPVAQPGKKIIFIASDLRNGGVIGVKNGFMEAMRVLAWSVEVKDGGGDLTQMQKILKEALHSNFDGVVIGGFQAPSNLHHRHGKSPILVGWHSSAKPGHTDVLFANITTDPVVVARRTADVVQKVGSKKQGIVIITDNQFSIAQEKVRQIIEALSACKTCRVLSVEDVPIFKADLEVPNLVVQLDKRFEKKWTHTIAVNDIYFDHMNFPLKKIHRSDVFNISAGDGSQVAIGRVKGGGSQQVVTVAEPLLAQGWQIADELNRAFAGEKESGYVSKPITISKDLLDSSVGSAEEGTLDFRETYSSIWKPRH